MLSALGGRKAMQSIRPGRPRCRIVRPGTCVWHVCEQPWVVKGAAFFAGDTALGGEARPEGAKLSCGTHWRLSIRSDGSARIRRGSTVGTVRASHLVGVVGPRVESEPGVVQFLTVIASEVTAFLPLTPSSPASMPRYSPLSAWNAKPPFLPASFHVTPM
jgi:hypothetical protein